MERNREVRRASMAATNGLSRRRHRSNSLRDSPEEDGPVELHEPARLRDRGVKKDRDRDRDRDRSSRSKRRRADRLMHGSNRDDGGEESTEESVNDEEEDDDDEGSGVAGGAVRMLPPNPAASMSSPLSNHHNQHRKSFPPSAKVFRAAPAWKAADEMIGVSVPRKARSASTKRSHEWNTGVGGEQIHRQASTSPVRPNLVSAPSPAPVSPSSSNTSVRKKMKPNGPKPRPPKSSSKSSSNPEELEIEIAEVLYGLKTQSQGPSKKDITVTNSTKFDSREMNKSSNDSAKFDFREVNKSSSDPKSRVSSPISNSFSTVPQSSVQNSSTAPLSAVAPKRKRPRQVSDNVGNYSARNSPISSTSKVDIDQPHKTEISSPNIEKTLGSGVENGGVPYDFGISIAIPPSSEPPPESYKPEGSAFSESKPLTEQAGESRDVVCTKVEATSPNKESPAVRGDDDREDITATKVNLTIAETENQREEKFQIDLMAPPPQLRSSPEREVEIDFVANPLDHKPMVSDVDAEMRVTAKDKGGEAAVKIGKEDLANVEPEGKKAKMMVEEDESQKPVINKEKNIVLQLDFEKPDRESGAGSAIGNKIQHLVGKQQQPTKVSKEEPHAEKTAQSSSLPLPMSMASWPGGLPPLGYMAPLQGVVSMNGSTISSTPLQPLFSQPRPKRCATHCYIAKNIHNFHQFLKMNPFWSAAAGSATLFGAKPCNLNVVAPAELHGNVAGRSVSSGQDKGQAHAIFPGHTGKDKGSQAANIADAAQRKQILLQQALPPGVPPNNILPGPAFIFPLSQQPAAAAASVRPGPAKSPTTTGSVASSNAYSSASVSASATAPATATAVGFNYPNIPSNETQYLAILHNNAYPFPIPPVGAPPSYRGTHAQAMPYFNGPFYSSQMIHPSQLQHQHQHQHQQQPTTQPQNMQQGHPNTSISTGGSSSHKPLHSQQRPQGSNANGGSGSGNLNSFSAPKNRPSVSPQHQQQANQHIPSLHQARQLESELGGEDSPSTAESQLSRATMSVYGQNFAMPIHPQNFALMTPPVFTGASSSSCGGNQNEKKQQQQPQQGLKVGLEPIPPQTFAVSFASINGATTSPGFDISSMAHNHAILQSLPEATRQQNYQILPAAAQAAQQKKNLRASEEGKTGVGDSSNVDEEKKGLAGRASATTGQSIAFSRSDLAEASVSTFSGSTVLDSSTRPGRTSRSAMQNTMGTVNAPISPHQAQLLHQQQIFQFQKQQQQQQMAAAASRSKAPATSNGSVYTDQLTSAKLQNVATAYPQNLVQSSSTSSASSPQWKNSLRTTTSQVPSSVASTPSSFKNHSQQQARNQQSHSQISFGASPKSVAASQGPQVPNNQSASPPMVVGSPTSSISKGASGSPRTTTSSSAGNKAAQPSTLSSQQTKNNPSVPSRKSSPVGGRSVPSILGSPHISSSTGTKPQMQQQQQQIPKQTLPQSQLFFSSNAYIQAHAPHSTSTSSTGSGPNAYYIQRRCSDQSQQHQQPQGSSATSSTGMLSLCTPVTLTSASTTDPAKAVAAAAAANNNMKGGGLSSQGILHQAQFTAVSSGNPHQLVPTGFSFHAVPAAVQVKPAEQKQPAGNDNLHACWQPEK